MPVIKKWWKLWETRPQKTKNENMNYSHLCTLGNAPSKTFRRGSAIRWKQVGGCCLVIEIGMITMKTEKNNVENKCGCNGSRAKIRHKIICTEC